MVAVMLVMRRRRVILSASAPSSLLGNRDPSRGTLPARVAVIARLGWAE